MLEQISHQAPFLACEKRHVALQIRQVHLRCVASAMRDAKLLLLQSCLELCDRGGDLAHVLKQSAPSFIADTLLLYFCMAKSQLPLFAQHLELQSQRLRLQSQKRLALRLRCM
jgi:hypothetical protein